MPNGVQRTGTNITGVSGAQHGAQKNAAAVQRAAGAAGQVGYEFGTELGAAGATGAAGAAGAAGAQLGGTNITGVSGAQHGARKNAQAVQRLAQKTGGQY